LIEYNDASAEVRAIYDDIMATRKMTGSTILESDCARSAALKRTWKFEAIMAGALDPLTKELIYVR